MRSKKNIYRTITVYNNGNSLRSELKRIGVDFTEQPIFDEFWGIEFKIQRPKGKDTKEKCREIDSL